MQAEREKSQSLEEVLEEMKTKLSNMEMASTAQEEYLMKLCQQSKTSAHRQGDLEDKCSELERQLQSHAVRGEGEREGEGIRVCAPVICPHLPQG